MKRKVFLPLILIVFLVGAFGCAYNASLVNTTHDMLTISANTYNTSMQIVADMYEQGKITGEQKYDITAAANAYAKMHNELVELLAVYEETKDAAEIEKIEAMVSRVSIALSTFMDLIEKYIVEEE